MTHPEMVTKTCTITSRFLRLFITLGRSFELQGIVPRAKLSYRQALQGFEGLDSKDEGVAQGLLDTTSALKAVYQQPRKDILRGQKRRLTPKETPEKRMK